jgi:uncharacterized protein HemY
MLQSRVAQGLGDEAGARHWLREAVRVAKAQEATGLELKAASALVEHPGSDAEDRNALTKVLDSLIEGAAEPEVLRARQRLQGR